MLQEVPKIQPPPRLQSKQKHSDSLQDLSINLKGQVLEFEPGNATMGYHGHLRIDATNY